MTQEQFITELASYRDLYDALVDSDRELWRAIFKGNDPDTEKILRKISEQATAISKTTDAMRVAIQTVK